MAQARRQRNAPYAGLSNARSEASSRAAARSETCPQPDSFADLLPCIYIAWNGDRLCDPRAGSAAGALRRWPKESGR